MSPSHAEPCHAELEPTRRACCWTWWRHHAIGMSESTAVEAATSFELGSGW